MKIRELYNYYKSSNGVCTDTREVKNGQIFFALKGENFDGNKFAHQALKKGCMKAVIDDPSIPANEDLLLVTDVLETLQELANLHRKKFDIPVLAITGSNGKTTTKELVYAVLSEKYQVYATEGNLNNHIGVPLTLLKLKNEEIAIIEMGANHPGEIHNLCLIADPDHGLITNIGKAHLEGFGSYEGVIRTKTELYRYLAKKDGHVFVNGDDAVLTNALSKLSLQQHSYIKGENLLCDGQVIPGNIFLEVLIRFRNDNEKHVATKLTGSYNLENILAAACIGKYFDVDEDKIIHALENYQPSNNRSQYYHSDKNTFILDAYNANPSSMAGAISNFLKIAHPDKMMILGDMLEMGQYSEAEHQNILRMIAAEGFENVYLVGKQFSELAPSFSFPHFANVEELIEHFGLTPVYNHLILVKGSRGIKLEEVLKVL